MTDRENIKELIKMAIACERQRHDDLPNYYGSEMADDNMKTIGLYIEGLGGDTEVPEGKDGAKASIDDIYGYWLGMVLPKL